MFELIQQVVPDWEDFIGEFFGTLGGFFAAGVLFAFILWAIGLAVNSVFRWLREWT